MDSVLYDAVTKDNIGVLAEMEQGLSVDKQLTPTKSTVLHVACQYGSMKCVEHILSVHISLLLIINSTGETALHLAAREGHYEVVVALLDAAESWLLKPESLLNTSLTVKQILIRTSDVEYETALHVAVRYNQKNIVQLLLFKDPCYSYPRNKYGETPLYMASVRCNTDIIRTIFDNSESPTFGGPNGRTALHAALLNDATYGPEILGNNGLECVKLLLEKNRDLIKIADNYGWTAFHYVAYNNLHTIVEDLVVANKSVGYLADTYHSKTALHVAAYQGHVHVMKKLVEHFPDSWETVDLHGKNILHIAVEHKQNEVIKFILSQGRKGINNLVIRRDKEGNTPLHLIAKLGYHIPELMDFRPALDWEVLNSEGLTPWDILDCLQTGSLEADHALVRTTLIQAKAKRQHLQLQDVEMKGTKESRNEKEREEEREQQLIDSYKKQNQWENESERRNLEKIEKVINTHIIVAALIATVALTAGFAMPGGFDGNKGKTQGSPLLLRKGGFQTFIITDAIALLFSISSLFLYFWTILIEGEAKITVYLFMASSLLNLVSIMAMMIAFISGTYVVLAHSLGLAISVCVISSYFFLLVIYVLFQIAGRFVG